MACWLLADARRAIAEELRELACLSPASAFSGCGDRLHDARLRLRGAASLDGARRVGRQAASQCRSPRWPSRRRSARSSVRVVAASTRTADRGVLAERAMLSLYRKSRSTSDGRPLDSEDISMSEYAKDVLVEPELARGAPRRRRHPHRRGRREPRALRRGPHPRRDRVRLEEGPAGPGQARLPRPGGLRRAVRTQRHLQRPHDRALRRPQQLVRRLHLLVPEVLRPRQVLLLNGPREKWIADGRPTSTEAPGHAPASVHRPARRRRDPRTPRGGAGRARRRHQARRRALARRVRRRDDLAQRLRAGGRPARRAHPRCGLDPVGAGRQRGRHLQVAPSNCASSTAQRACSTARTSSPTAASASARRTPGSSCTSCSARSTSRTTTARGRSGGASWACR